MSNEQTISLPASIGSCVNGVFTGLPNQTYTATAVKDGKVTKACLSTDSAGQLVGANNYVRNNCFEFGVDNGQIQLCNQDGRAYPDVTVKIWPDNPCIGSTVGLRVGVEGVTVEQ